MLLQMKGQVIMMHFSNTGHTIQHYNYFRFRPVALSWLPGNYSGGKFAPSQSLSFILRVPSGHFHV